jgi:ABC-2 type transport system permease protein
VLFGYAVNLDPKPVPMVLSRGSDGVGPRLQGALDETGYFSIVADDLDAAGATAAVAEGRALVGIELPLPLDYDDPDAAAEPARIVVDGTDPAAVRPALAALERAWWRESLRACSIGGRAGPDVDVEWLHNPAVRTDWAIVPGLVGVIVMISMLMLGALTLVRERERGTWEALLATPVDALDALLGKLSPYLFLGTVQAGIVLALARILFDLPVTGSLVALLLAIPLFALAHLVLGFAFSALADSQMQAIQGAVLFYLPSMLLSGFLFPFQGMPGWAKAIGEALPLTHFLRATRGVLLGGAGLEAVALELVPVAAFAGAAGGLALVAYRRRID